MFESHNALTAMIWAHTEDAELLRGGGVAAGLPGRGACSAAARLWMRAHTMLGVSSSGRLSACEHGQSQADVCPLQTHCVSCTIIL